MSYYSISKLAIEEKQGQDRGLPSYDDQRDEVISTSCIRPQRIPAQAITSPRSFKPQFQ